MCLYPLFIKTKDAFGVYINQSVPCGKCIECVKDRQNEWKIRLVEECRDHRYIYFFTLTYRDDTIEWVNDTFGIPHTTFRKSDYQLWFKRSRIYYERYFNREIDFKYFLCTEYGPNTGRAHAHGLLFTDISETFISHMFNDWSNTFGFANYSRVGVNRNKRTSTPSAVGNYVAKYCLKPRQLMTDAELEVDSLIKEGVLLAPFRLMSKGIGESYVKRMKRYHVPSILSPSERIVKIVDRSNYNDGAFKYKLPRYYRDRLYRMKFPYDQNVWNKKLKCYETKTVYRYASKNPLAIQIQIEVRNRLLAEYNRTFEDLKSKFPSKSDTQIHLEIERIRMSSKIHQSSCIYSKLSRFYKSNRFKNRKF